MSKSELKGNTRPRIELPKRLWLVVKGAAPWKGKSPSGLVEQIIQEWLDEHVTFKVNGKEIKIKEVT